MFMYDYMKKVMFLNGHCDHWNSITDLGNAGMLSIPRA